ncbi:DinB family protein [Paenibacillus sp. XY044]|uniref:DinB family protein n=1 Tax=Paenibacillus sp. XY044 TaxID=2026089 RepID=UPI000B998346|nr:DinB family protein [Paenibacillus sp. XY044]OZB98409.1 hypothetical protein CJP46_04440 [Paenibacillus sp. XY044]
MVKFQDIIPYMDNVRQQLIEVLDAFGSGEKNLREMPEGWSVTEVVEHLGRLERMIQFQLKKAIQAKPVLPSEPMEKKMTDVAAVLHGSGIVGQKFEAPEPARPTGLSYEEAIHRLDEVRAATKALITQLAERNTNDLLFPHPFGFSMNAAQWAHFIAIHETLHIEQLTRIREANR